MVCVRRVALVDAVVVVVEGLGGVRVGCCVLVGGFVVVASCVGVVVVVGKAVVEILREVSLFVIVVEAEVDVPTETGLEYRRSAMVFIYYFPFLCSAKMMHADRKNPCVRFGRIRSVRSSPPLQAFVRVDVQWAVMILVVLQRAGWSPSL